MINKTLGTGGDFATWAALQTFFQAAILTDDYTVTQISDLSVSAVVAWSRCDFNGHTVTITQSTSMLGNPTLGFKTTFSTAFQVISFATQNSPTNIWKNGSFVLDNLRFECSAISTYMVFFGRGTNGVHITVKNCLFHVASGSGGLACQLFSTYAAPPPLVQPVFDIFNCAALCEAGASGGFFLDASGTGTIGKINAENLTALWGVGASPLSAGIEVSGANVTLRNSYARFIQQSGTTSTKDHNGSNFTTVGTGSLSNLVQANEFVSASWASADFGKLKTTSLMLGAGSAPSISGNTVGIRGGARPGSDGLYSIGSDEGVIPPPTYSFAIGFADAIPMRPWPTHRITPAILWIQDSAGYWHGSDRGAAQDVYEATALFQGLESDMNDFEETLEAAREQVDISGFETPLFAPNVDHTGTVNAVVQSMRRRQVQYGSPSHIYELEVGFRAIAPTLLTTTPSLSTLRVQDGFDAGHSYTSPKAFTYDQTAQYGDARADVGTFEATFQQSTAEAQAILAYILITARANAVAWPAALSSVAYPWGRSRGTPTNCKILGVTIARKNLNRWILKIKFGEAP